MSRAPVLAALASIPSRAHLLSRVLSSLRPQVDRLCVYLNGWTEVPACVRELATEYVLDETNRGAERKLHWSSSHDGYYLSCDDDFCYLEGYAQGMVSAVEQWQGRAIVTGHGRQYVERPVSIYDVVRDSVGHVVKKVPVGRWANTGGTGCMAWDARRIRMPTEWPERNNCDLQVALWAQREHVPIWVLPHEKDWIEPLASIVDPDGIFKRSARTNHKHRGELLRAHGREHGWGLFTCQ